MAFAALLEFQGRRGIWPALHDPLTAAAAVGLPFVEFDEKYVDFRDDGSYRLGQETRVIISTTADYDGFMNYFSGLL